MMPQGENLMPESPELRAIARIWIGHIESRIIANFYRFLMNANDLQSRGKFYDAVVEFSDGMEKVSSEGFFFGEKFSLVDIALAPWFQRLCVLEHYRKFALQKDDLKLMRVWNWWNAVQNYPAYVRTVVDEERLVQSYVGYADGSATSDCAQKYQQKKL
jgi:glutathione S-transferase